MTVKQKREHIKTKNSRRQLRAQYVYGNTVPNVNPKKDTRGELRAVNTNIRKKEHRATMNAGYVLFLTFMMSIAVFFCFRYLELTTAISNNLTEIAKLEASLNSLKEENNDYENRINGNVDLELIKKRAMTDLGMQYANDDQKVIYESDDTDYVRQYISIEE